MRPERHHHVYLCADALNKAANFGKIRWHIERAIHRTQNIHTRGSSLFTLFLFGHPAFGHAEFRKDPRHCAVRCFPLIFINCARQKALNVCAHRRDTAADHLGDRARDNNGWQCRIKSTPRTLHCTFGTVTAKFFFAQTRHHNWQLMGRQTIGIMQY